MALQILLSAQVYARQISSRQLSSLWGMRAEAEQEEEDEEEFANWSFLTFSFF